MSTGALIPMIVGGTPGTFLRSKLANWVSQSVIRQANVTVLTLTGPKMLASRRGTSASSARA